MKRTIVRMLIALLPSVAITEGLPWLLQPILAPQDPTAPMWLRLALLPLFLPLGVLLGMAFARMEYRMCSSGSEISLPNAKEHAPSPAGASADTHQASKPTENSENRAAGDGCCGSSCSESSFFEKLNGEFEWVLTRTKDPDLGWVSIFEVKGGGHSVSLVSVQHALDMGLEGHGALAL